MDKTTVNWINLAEYDLQSAVDLFKADKPITNSICFHAQQCVEKYLKAYLTFNKKFFRKTHDIAELIELCIEVDKEFNTLYQYNIDDLTNYAIEIRYPDDFYIPTIEEAQESIAIAEKVKEFVSEKLKREKTTDGT